MSTQATKQTGTIAGLLRQRRMWPLAVTQACGALNDNLVRNAMIVLALFRLGIGGAGLSALAGGLFMAPYVLLSATAGQIADRFPKRQVILAAKIAEIILMLWCAAAFLTASVPGLCAVLFGLGVQAAVFGPVKYGMLADLLPEPELVAGNGILEGSTFLAIVAGTIAGGALILAPSGAALVGATGIALACLGLAAACLIPAAGAGDAWLRIDINPLAATWHVTRAAMVVRPVRLCILGLSWFWVVGATLMAELPVVARDVLHAGGPVLTLLLTIFAVGIGLGSVLCARLLKGDVSARHVPFAAVGISLFLWDFARACAGGVPHDVLGMLTTAAGWRIAGDLLALTICGGVFSVPLYAVMQDNCAPAFRSRTIAANNVMNALFMVAGAAAAAGLSALHYSPVSVLKITALANLTAAASMVRIMPQEVSRVLLRLLFRFAFRVQVTGLEHYAGVGDRVVMVCNHLSYGDAALVSAMLPQSPVFAIHAHQMRYWWVRAITSMVRIFPVDAANPYAVKRMVEAVRDDGQKLMVFPEGRISVTGSLMKVFEGAAVIADKASAKILPIRIDGPQFSPLGHMAGILPMRWFPRLRVTIFPAVDITPRDAETLAPRARRAKAGRALQELMVQTAYAARDTNKTLFAATLDAARLYGHGLPIAEDTARTPIPYSKVILGAAALGRKLAAAGAQGDYVGLMMPNANATLVALLGLSAFNRVPAMLNFSAGAEGMLSACAAARVTRVVSSRAFVEKAKLGAVVARMQQDVEFIWLEDVKETIGPRDKLRAAWDAWRPRALPGATAPADSPAVVMFTSGSEGVPKGVVLSHRNILANCAQLAAVIDFNPADRVFSALPMFHAFGLVAGTLLPLLSGVRTFLYPSPLHYRIVPALIYDTDATICFGTDTFLNGWARYANPYDFYRMRYAFAGAEKVREETKKLFAERFGVRVLEGYGATETSPVLAINTAMHSRASTVGKLLPGIEHRVTAVPGVHEGGTLSVRGPNVMLGYMRASAPGVIEQPCDGWYDTGDIVDIDADGFVAITGRVKRFAKIAGEMISMPAAEALAASLWPEEQHAVVAIPDARKGEQLLLLTTRRDATPTALLAQARARGLAEIAVPRVVHVVDKVPLLGSGKTDYPAAQKIAEALRMAKAA